MRTLLIPVLTTLFVASCSSDGTVDVGSCVSIDPQDGALIDNEAGVTVDLDELPTSATVETPGVVTVNGTGETVVVNSDVKTELSILGTNHTVNIETDLTNLLVSGSNNLLIFSDNVSVESCVISGSDNTAQKSDSVSITCEDNGSGNSGF